MAVVCEPDRDDEVLRQAASGILAGLEAAPELDVSCWRFARGGSWRRPVRRGAPPAPLGPKGVRGVRWEAVSLSPRLLAAGLGAGLIAGPTASRPRALIALGAEGAGTIAAALGRMLDVPVVTVVLPGDLANGWSPRALDAARRADRLMAADVESVDRLARRGFAPWRPEVGVEVRPTDDAWLDLGRQLAAGLVQGVETSISSS